MNNKTRYLYVVNPGNLSGVTFFTSYDVENVAGELDALPETEGTEQRRSGWNRKWTEAVVRLPKAAQRLVREYLQRKGQVVDAAA